MILETVKATPRGNAGGPRNASLTASASNTALFAEKQRQIDPGGPPPDAIAECDEFLLDEIYHDLSLIWSYATSAMEAARRGDREELTLRLRIQLRDCFRHAVEMHNLLSTGQRTGVGA
jgi:hypothetical protein